MAHVSKQLLDAVTAAVTGLPTTGDRVQKSRTYAHKSGPALSIRLGARETLSIVSNAFINAQQDIHIDITVAGPTDSIDDQLLDIDAEMHRALMTDPQLGLDFVRDADPQGLSEPDIEQGERPKAVATSSWRYQLRHSLTDPET